MLKCFSNDFYYILLYAEKGLLFYMLFFAQKKDQISIFHVRTLTYCYIQYNTVHMEKMFSSLISQ
jgi:hypothetical protein